ncbi:ribosomal protection-like ABC-F family protein [Spirochaeta cellobiosiphila]|uniref:ribosomal protection-like ABC-F family protein n=1 Tax=Spirochaeta cellobiosiphila TaxID=504483 RepID=UPI000403D793|nr:ABC-F family ATP-binding cassette domain-containing protein [Spirochaeta cellobiosiphila]
MNLITINNLTHSFSEEPLFENISVDINKGDKIGLIGPNGAGKSTLLKIILGQLQSTEGKVSTTPDISIGYVPQMLAFNRIGTINDVILEDYLRIQQNMNMLEEQMANTKDLDKVLADYQKCQDKFEALGGWEAQDRALSLLRRLGMENDLDTDISVLSGGEQSLLYFVKALLYQPDLLILDEPGNHLDFIGLAWLEQFLRGYPGAVLVISHNRYLLEKVTDELWHIERGQFNHWKGKYSQYRIQLLQSQLQQKKAIDHLDKSIHETTSEVKQLQARASSSYNPPVGVLKLLNTAKVKLKQLQEERNKLNIHQESAIKINLQGQKHRSDIALKVQEYSFCYSDKTIFKDINFEVFSSERVALIGANGSGKSTLIREILDKGDWENSLIRLNPSTKLGYIGQDIKFDTEDGTIEEEVRTWGSLSQSQAFNVMAPYQFDYQEMNKSIKLLSGGERQRLQLAKLSYLETNFLILDEPTNHLDIKSREILEDCLKDYPGTLFIVSHDRYFLDRVIERVLFIEEEKIHSFYGSFTDFFRKRYQQLPHMGNRLHNRRRTNTEDKTFQDQSWETKITQWEVEKEDLQREIDSLTLKNKFTEALAMTNRLSKLQKKLDIAYSQWDHEL